MIWKFFGIWSWQLKCLSTVCLCTVHFTGFDYLMNYFFDSVENLCYWWFNFNFRPIEALETPQLTISSQRMCRKWSWLLFLKLWRPKLPQRPLTSSMSLSLSWFQIETKCQCKSMHLLLLAWLAQLCTNAAIIKRDNKTTKHMLYSTRGSVLLTVNCG